MILGEYYLRSHLFEQSLQSYGRVVTREPTNHRALRGLHAAAAELGEYDLAAKAWTRAMQADPKDQVSRSFLVWALAAGADPKAEAACDLLLTNSPDDAFGHFSRMLIAIRRTQLEQAIEHMRAGLACPVQLDTAEAAYAATTLERLSRRLELPRSGYLFAAAIWKAQGASQRALNAMICFHTGSPTEPVATGESPQAESDPGSASETPPRATFNSSEIIDRLGLESLSKAVLESNQLNSINCY
jgi:tetratricopeptide (TPR) repeat protein